MNSNTATATVSQIIAVSSLHPVAGNDEEEHQSQGEQPQECQPG